MSCNTREQNPAPANGPREFPAALRTSLPPRWFPSSPSAAPQRHPAARRRTGRERAGTRCAPELSARSSLPYDGLLLHNAFSSSDGGEPGKSRCLY